MLPQKIWILSEPSFVSLLSSWLISSCSAKEISSWKKTYLKKLGFTLIPGDPLLQTYLLSICTGILETWRKIQFELVKITSSFSNQEKNSRVEDDRNRPQGRLKDFIHFSNHDQRKKKMICQIFHQKKNSESFDEN